jgi:cytochrome c peroxidase
MSGIIRVFLLPTLLFLAALHATEPIRPIPVEADYDRQKAELGKLLFFDPILSKDQTLSCASCHDFEFGGADRRPVSVGVGKQMGNIQSPTVLNARYNFKQFWNGRAENLLEQAAGPIHNPVELDMTPEAVTRRIDDTPFYREQFASIYGSDLPISYQMILETIVEFEKALTTPNSRFDRYLRGELELSDAEMKGYQTFKTLGCITCHNGINIGGNSFQRMGIIHPYRYDERYPDLYSATHDDLFKNVFKVPTLRNIELTAPYFHDASAENLEKAVKIMSHHNLGFTPTDEQVRSLVAFLKSLTGDLPEILE